MPINNISKQLTIKYLGLRHYEKTHQDMIAHISQPHAENEIWLLEHYPVYTQGRAGKPEHILNRNHNIPVIQTDRGGQVTYHGPGQLIIYPLLAIKDWNLQPLELVSRLEQLAIQSLKQLGIHATTKASARGVYVAGEKIASIGLKIKQGYSYHGMAININMDLDPFNAINPCGYPDLTMTQVNHHHTMTIQDFIPLWTKNLLETFQPYRYNLQGVIYG